MARKARTIGERPWPKYKVEIESKHKYGEWTDSLAKARKFAVNFVTVYPVSAVYIKKRNDATIPAYGDPPKYDAFEKYTLQNKVVVKKM